PPASGTRLPCRLFMGSLRRQMSLCHSPLRQRHQDILSRRALQTILLVWRPYRGQLGDIRLGTSKAPIASLHLRDAAPVVTVHVTALGRLSQSLMPMHRRPFSRTLTNGPPIAVFRNSGPLAVAP